MMQAFSISLSLSLTHTHTHTFIFTFSDVSVGSVISKILKYHHMNKNVTNSTKLSPDRLRMLSSIFNHQQIK